MTARTRQKWALANSSVRLQHSKMDPRGKHCQATPLRIRTLIANQKARTKRRISLLSRCWSSYLRDQKTKAMTSKKQLLKTARLKFGRGSMKLSRLSLMNVSLTRSTSCTVLAAKNLYASSASWKTDNWRNTHKNAKTNVDRRNLVTCPCMWLTASWRNTTKSSCCRTNLTFSSNPTPSLENRATCAQQR